MRPCRREEKTTERPLGLAKKTTRANLVDAATCRVVLGDTSLLSVLHADDPGTPLS